ncbi:hypothetical protein PROFUN_12885 [Planoprotostelium fungivorum]|uniref:Uncharacterized protein n=1 Tax=Planoprotostelium fungivorum TaxID=1890364 RepID=A0A2P6MWI7_9EUKA|nr:hypothetical protein PROFUN_12885 [Planoprotostelium fungivorum]
MLAALGWVKHGAAKPVPARDIDEEREADEEFDGVDVPQEDEDSDEEMQEDEEASALNRARQAALSAGADDLSIYNLDDYDNEEDDTGLIEQMNDDFNEDGFEDDDLSDIDDVTIRPTDAILLGVHTEEDVSHLDMYVYESKDDNLYVHHDILIPSHPLCVEWLDYHSTNPGSSGTHQGNLAAVGTFEPEIQIWDMDIIDALTPVMVLGGELPESKRVAKRLKNKKRNNEAHTDAVMGLAWNRMGRNFLASCSADHSIKLWDLSKGSCLLTMTQHNDKVQSIQWHPTEATVLLSAAYDKTARVTDVRSPNGGKFCDLSADAECIQWMNNSPEYFMVSAEDGTVTCYDVRNLNQQIWTLMAHGKPVSGLSYNRCVNNLLATSSTDKQIKFWNISEQKPKLLHTIKVGFPVFALSWYNDDSQPFLLAAGGEGDGQSEDEGRLNVWDARHFEPVANAFVQ